MRTAPCLPRHSAQILKDLVVCASPPAAWTFSPASGLMNLPTTLALGFNELTCAPRATSSALPCAFATDGTSQSWAARRGPAKAEHQAAGCRRGTHTSSRYCTGNAQPARENNKKRPAPNWCPILDMPSASNLSVLALTHHTDDDLAHPYSPEQRHKPQYTCHWCIVRGTQQPRSQVALALWSEVHVMLSTSSRVHM